MKDEEARLNTGLGFVGWFLGIDAFLIGVILANYTQFGVRFRVPILFLVSSLIGFIQAARFYRDGSGSTEYAKAAIGLTARKMFELGNIISEFIGINMLIFAIPIMISLLIKDTFVVYTTAFLISVSFGLYLISEYTIVARRYLVPIRVPVAIITSACLFISSISSQTRLFYLCLVPFVVSLLLCIHSIVFLRYKEL
jgi:hypothetical protein